ncbi:MAG: hypothetical protein KTR31_13455 [Myxococcales bacterium]|nr:hypothetical protein [Myxococcales bacterium]
MPYLAMSCLQGRPMAAAFDALCALQPDGIQLTPGNLPTPSFHDHVHRCAVPTRTHHGFAFDARRQPVWIDGRCVVSADSVHPTPGMQLPVGPALETMYPGHPLGDDDALQHAMADGLRLAVDVSHAFIGMSQGVLTDRVWRRLMDYDRIVEVHVSANDGRHDTHRPIEPDTFGLDWAREREQAGVPVVLESYFHKLDRGERQRQLDICRGSL